MFHVPEQSRVKTHSVPALNSDESFGNNGLFNISFSKDVFAWVIVSDGEGWEHVSIHVIDNTPNAKERTPTWEEMCKIKDIFWDEEDCVIQYHPPKSQYVNNHNYVLHLWRPIGKEIPMPDSVLIGIK